jgi:hypothetical protein
LSIDKLPKAKDEARNPPPENAKAIFSKRESGMTDNVFWEFMVGVYRMNITNLLSIVYKALESLL